MVLVIFQFLLSSGRCDDIDEIIEEMEQHAQHLPFSLVVVGVGDNSFSQWKRLHKKMRKNPNTRELGRGLNKLRLVWCVV